MKGIFAFATLFACGLAIADDSSIWSGPYAGVFAAQTRLVVQSDATAEPGPLGNGFGRVEISEAMTGLMTWSDTERTQQVRPGVYAGYLWRQGPWVYGLEADLQDGVRARISGYNSSRLRNFPANTQVYQYEQVFDLHYLATLRGRVGYAQDNWLLYLTAGIAHAKLSTELNAYPPLLGPTAPPVASPLSSNSSSANRTGWVAGMGGEYAATPRLRIRAEYLHHDLGEMRVNSNSTVLYNTGALFSSANGRVKSDWRSSSGRIGISYSF